MFGFQPDVSAGPITRQLCAHLRSMIEGGELPAGTRLPPTRTLARELRVARNVAIDVYEQLTAEGYLESRIGSGTYIAEGIQVRPRKNEPSSPIQPAAMPPAAKERGDIIDFNGGIPDLQLFPRKLWAKYLREAADYAPDDLLGYGDPVGELELRKALVRYLFRIKGIRCHPGQVIVVSGSSEGFLLIASALADRFQTAFIEDPTVDFVPDVFRRFGYAIRPVEVDGHGMDIGRIDPEGEGLIVLTPSHQYPTGSILSIQRRQMAVRLAEANGFYILEDDYDSEFRHKGVPVPPLQALSPNRVIYAGTFSKTLSPGLRLGFLVVPPQLIGEAVRAKTELNLHTSSIPQAALARFIENGHFDRHVHRMKAVYMKRRMKLEAELKRHFGSEAELRGDEAGMHAQVAFPEETHSRIHWADAERFGVRLSSLEDYAIVKGRNRHKVVLGYGRLSEEQIAEGVARLHRFVTDAIRVIRE
ncbi:PLP-dependent aminotransferase family protein [Paenibacillus hamazuiensis]|uniref:MocR-like pyridoxine biosynthesis transcription factor PdxR n=1 Tax=Paenibacillus hamazuiensis TaxID=2936508 RepID=UPI0020105DDA|nr:PLP-dependent aminotransferase family protein [Paenibacillus hamazuiensis]